MDAALNFAAEHLPVGYEIEIGVENGSAWATLLDPTGGEVSDGAGLGDSGWHEIIAELVNEARELQSLPPVSMEPSRSDRAGVDVDLHGIVAGHLGRKYGRIVLVASANRIIELLREVEEIYLESRYALAGADNCANHPGRIAVMRGVFVDGQILEHELLPV